MKFSSDRCQFNLRIYIFVQIFFQFFLWSCYYITLFTTMMGTINTTNLDPWGGKETNIGDELGLGNRDPREIAASVIRVILGFLGIIAVIIILLGGFKWMTAGGNEDKVGEAKKLIIAGVIGLIIILASWGIATFVINALVSATGNG